MAGVHRGLFSLLGALLISAAVMSTGYSREEVIERIQARYEQTRSWQAKFIEVSVNRSLGIELEKHGQAYFKKPGLMRWEYDTPERRLIVSDGQSLWVYSPDDEQVFVASIESLYRADAPILFLTGQAKLTDHFDISVIGGEQPGKCGQVVLEMVPWQQQVNLAKLRIVADAESFQIVGTVIYDHFGNTADIRFSDISTEADLPANLFEFSVPPGAEVIDASQIGE